MTKRLQTAGFSLVEMIVSVSIIAILFASVSTIITQFLKSRMNASEFVQVQDESYTLVQQLQTLVKNAENVFAYPSNITGSNYRFDNLLVQNNAFADAPFSLVRAFKKSVEEPVGSIKHLDELYALEKDRNEEFFMGMSSLYFWSDLTSYDDLGKMILYPNPQTGELLLFDVTRPKLDAMKYAVPVVFPNKETFVLPTGIEKLNKNTYFVSDRSDHTVWKVTIDASDFTQKKVAGTREKILGASGVAGALMCDKAVTEKLTEEADCSGTLLNQPNGLFYTNGFLYVVDSKNHRLLSWSETGAVEEVIANPNYEAGMSASGEDRKKFFMNTPVDVTVDDRGNIFVSDMFNHRVLCLKSGEEKVEVVAGTGEKGFSGDYGDGLLAKMSFPSGLSFQRTKNIKYPNFIQKIERTDSSLTITFKQNLEGNVFIDDFNIVAPGGKILAKDAQVQGDSVVLSVESPVIERISFQQSALQFEDATSVPSFSVNLETASLFISDSGNNAVRELRFIPFENGNEFGLLFTRIGNAQFQIIPDNYISRLLSKNATTIDPNLGHRFVSRKKPPASSNEVILSLQQRGTENELQLVHKLPTFQEAQFYFNTGLFQNTAGDFFIVDSVNNQIKLAPISDEIFEDEGNFPQVALTLNLGELTKAHLQGKVFPIVRSEDFGNYNFSKHEMTAEKDAIANFPLKHMYFSVSGEQSKIVQCNIAIEGLKTDGIASNNFQFSLNLKNPVQK